MGEKEETYAPVLLEEYDSSWVSKYETEKDFLTGSTKDKRNVLGINSGKSNAV